MKKYLLIILACIFVMSCNVPSHTLMGFYEIGNDDTGVFNTLSFITLINSSELQELGGDGQTIQVYVFFFDDNEKLIKCHRDELSPDDMIVLDVQKILDFPSPVALQAGVFKCIAVDSENNLISTLVGFQTKQYFKEKEVIAVSESGLFATTSKVTPGNFMKMCDVNK
jgi:hypothetical protein